MSVNWLQLGDDFKQKYETTFCHYHSPITKRKEIFQIVNVEPYSVQPPDINLYNDRLGELNLRWTTETELDFEFPEVGYFQHDDRALIFRRLYVRQWKKGICPNTAEIVNPYSSISEGAWSYRHLDAPQLTSAFVPFIRKTLTEGLKTLEAGKALSIALTKRIAVGLGNTSKAHILWYDQEPVAEVLNNGHIDVREKDFEQEIRDFIRDTGEHGHTISVT